MFSIWQDGDQLWQGNGIHADALAAVNRAVDEVKAGWELDGKPEGGFNLVLKIEFRPEP